MKEKIRVVILAGGKGKRMEAEMPKALLPIRGVPMIKYLLKALEKSQIKTFPTIVVGVGAEEVKKTLGPSYEYVVQEKQLGTGHAALSAEKNLAGRTEHIMVLYGDHPLVSSETIDRLAASHFASENVLTMATAKISDFEDWRAGFYDFGRVIRNKNGEIDKIVEKKDGNEGERRITEVNPSYFCFESNWLWINLKKIGDKNAAGEFYLTDLPRLARDQKLKINGVQIPPIEALGANTPEQLAVLESLTGNTGDHLFN